jgi:hypothetical protein
VEKAKYANIRTKIYVVIDVLRELNQKIIFVKKKNSLK